MFAEYLKDHPMRTLLTGAPPMSVPAAEDRAAWERVPARYARELLRREKAWSRIPYPMRTASGFLAFTDSGSRRADEEPYFFRRRKLCVAAVARCLVPERVPMEEIADGIWCVCEESSWVISAHNVNPVPGAPAPREKRLPDPEEPYIDLFAAQTGMILALIRRMLGRELDRVSPALAARIRYEIKRRILRPFLETDDFWWMGVRRKDLNNWTPWICSNVILCAGLEEDSAALAETLERACAMLDRWLETVPADGGCDEGAGYWNMAGGALLDCLEALESMTGGQMSFREDEKVRRILTFPRKVRIGKGWFLNFADCDARPFLSEERTAAAGLLAGDAGMIRLSREIRESPLAELDDTPHLSRLLKLLFREPRRGAGRAPAEDAWLPDLQVRLVRRGRWVLGCKGGHNGENHNHNDVGSLILYLDGEPALVDAGNRTYTAKTFSDQRYTLWNTRSAYHNLPLIGGAEQRDGREFAAKDVLFLPDGLALNLESAYPAETGLVFFRRETRLGTDGLRVTDRIVTREDTPKTWIWMFREKPVIRGRRLTAGALRLTVPESFSAEREEIPVRDARMARSFPGSLWRVKLTSPPAAVQEIEWFFGSMEEMKR